MPAVPTAPALLTFGACAPFLRTNKPTPILDGKTMTHSIRALAEGFPALTAADWTPLAIKALRGADFDETLARQTVDGVTRGPIFFNAPDGTQPVDVRPRNPHLPWGMRQALVEASPQAANAAALDDLMGGASELELRLDASGLFGLAASDIDTLDAALKGIDMSLAPIHLNALNNAADHADWLIALFARRRLDGEELRGGLGLSPIEKAGRLGRQVRKGELKHIAKIARLSSAAFPKLKIMRCDASLAHEAGGSDVQELAMLAASAATYMRLLMDSGFSADDAAMAIEARLVADTDIHLTIAKLRAARRIFACITKAFGASTDGQHLNLHVVTSGRMLSATDPWSNLIRIACAGFAGAVGGADAMTIRPMTDPIGRPTRFARRVARNLHILLAEESHLGKVTDPASGSYLHESLSAGLADKAWQMFQDIEKQGGLAQSLETGWLQGQIASSREARLAEIADGREVILGVTKFADPDPKALEVDGPWPKLEIVEGALTPMRFAASFEGAAS
jgi:methylmalonyl-CoA mutase